MHLEMHITAFEGLLDAACAQKNKKKQVETMGASKRRWRHDHLGAAHGESGARELQGFRVAVRAWAVGLGYKAFNKDDNQAWQAGVKSKLKRRLAAIGVR